MKALHEIKQDLVRVCRSLDAREYVGGRDGNVSVRISATTILITPAGMRKGDVAANDLLLLDRRGNRLEGRRKPSTESGMHLKIYDARPDVRAIVHAHPPAATGFAAAGRGITGCFLPEVIVGLGEVPVVPYALPGTEEVSAALAPLLPGHDAFLLANHGVVTVGEDVDHAHQRMETVEQSARILLAARLLGGAHALPPEEVQRLLESRARYGVRENLAGCETGSSADDALVERVVERVIVKLRQS
jgi:L-fuculose-phosphate aldolase